MLGRWRKGGRTSQGSGGAKLPHPPVKTVPSPWESCSRTAQRVLRGSPYGTLRGGQGGGAGAGVGTGGEGRAPVLPPCRVGAAGDAVRAVHGRAGDGVGAAACRQQDAGVRRPLARGVDR